MAPTALRSASASVRVERAARWLAARAPAEEVLVVAATPDAAHELLRGVALGRGAAFGWHRVTLGRLAAELAAPLLVERGLVPVGRLGAEAAMARVLHGLGPAGSAGANGAGLGRYAVAACAPGFARATAAALAELRLAGAEAASLVAAPRELRGIFEAYAGELAGAGLVDRALLLALAAQAARDPVTRHALLGLPTLLLDVPLGSRAERELVAALAARSPELWATAPAGDDATLEHLRALGFALEDAAGEAPPASEAYELPEAAPDERADARDEREEASDESQSALGPLFARRPAARRAPARPAPARAEGSSLLRLQAHLFEEAAPAPSPLDDSVVVLSAPGEARECVEIARHLLRLAGAGVPFDRMAILLRSPEEYRPHLAEALGRAGIPAHFARGAVRPDPAGRALLALLACAAEGLSARRFAEYLSLGETPDAGADGTPPAPRPAGERWVAPDEEMVPEAVAAALSAASTPGAQTAPASGSGASDPGAAPVTAGTLRAPRRWERLLVDAAVIGGRERWARRLAGLARQLELELAELASEDPDDPRLARLRRQRDDLAALHAYALPLVDALAALPDEAEWGVWLDALSALATRVLRRPERVLSVLAELAPMAGVGPVTLGEVQLVLGRRLLDVAVPPPASRHGCVYVAPAEAARGLVFDVVCVPGLAEQLFPRKISEEPILLDALRERLALGLDTNHERVARERLALRLAVGAARRRVALSYPRLDLEKSRPRVPSFYALEALRAAEGRLPGFDELARRAEHVVPARVGWPAPARPADAIDEAEHDLALIDGLLRLDAERSVGTARYLLEANPHLGRALRFRARRWIPAWTPADGLVPHAREGLPPPVRAAIAAHRLAARSYSPTALQHYATCPYKFFLYAVHRLEPRDVPEAIDEMDPLQRGSLVHQVQFELYGRLAAEGLLPVTDLVLGHARELLDEVLDSVAARAREELAPAIDRVWDDGIAQVRADLREWLRRTSEDASGFVPWRFELSFGLAESARSGASRSQDEHSRGEPVGLDCGLRLRGSIDLVERHGDGRVRVTDHKTGRKRGKAGQVIGGGESLQPVLYALAAEKLFEASRVEAGRLYYCTSAGGFEEVVVPLDKAAREAAAKLAEVIGGALDEPFLPAAPQGDACRWCDYAVVCGPYEALRTRRKWPRPLEPLTQLRSFE